MLNFLGYVIASCGMALIFLGANASDSDWPLYLVIPMGVGGLIVFIFGILIAKEYE